MKTFGSKKSLWPMPDTFMLNRPNVCFFFSFLYLSCIYLSCILCVLLWDCTICLGKCFDLYSKLLGTSKMCVQHAEWIYVWTWPIISHEASLLHTLSALCIVAAWCCVWECCDPHPPCPLIRQPVQVYESAAWLQGCWGKCFLEICVSMY